MAATVTKPARPSGVQVKAQDSTIYVTWEPVNGADAYCLEKKATGYFYSSFEGAALDETGAALQRLKLRPDRPVWQKKLAPHFVLEPKATIINVPKGADQTFRITAVTLNADGKVLLASDPLEFSSKAPAAPVDWAGSPSTAAKLPPADPALKAELQALKLEHQELRERYNQANAAAEAEKLRLQQQINGLQEECATLKQQLATKAEKPVPLPAPIDRSVPSSPSASTGPLGTAPPSSALVQQLRSTLAFHQGKNQQLQRELDAAQAQSRVLMQTIAETIKVLQSANSASDTSATEASATPANSALLPDFSIAVATVLQGAMQDSDSSSTAAATPLRTQNSAAEEDTHVQWFAEELAEQKRRYDALLSERDALAASAKQDITTLQTNFLAKTEECARLMREVEQLAEKFENSEKATVLLRARCSNLQADIRRLQSETAAPPGPTPGTPPLPQ